MTGSAQPAPGLYVVKRALCMQGERVEPDTVITLPPHQAAELVACGRVAPHTGPVELAEPAPPPAPARKTARRAATAPET